MNSNYEIRPLTIILGNNKKRNEKFVEKMVGNNTKIKYSYYPEHMLSPQQQLKLGDKFTNKTVIANMKKYDLKEIIFTHSENMLLRIRRKIADGRFNKDDIIIYYLDDYNNEPLVIAFNEFGEYTCDEKSKSNESFRNYFSQDYLEVIKMKKIVCIKKYADEDNKLW